MNRAYSVLTVKAVEEDQRIIRGTATTPSPDRMGDVVEPLGIKFKNPLPLLHQHRSSEPVGTVKFDKPTKDGIEFEARLPKVDEPPSLKDRVDSAWAEVKLGLVRAVSIGFRPIEYSFMDDGGVHFLECEVLELSLVTIPAQQDATIQVIRSIDAPLLAATGHEQRADPPLPAPRDPKATIVVKALEATKMKKTFAEQIASFEATRASKAARMAEIMDAAAEKGETLDAAGKEEYDGLADEVTQVDEHLARLRNADKANKAAAAPVAGADPAAATAARGAVVVATVRSAVQKGIPFMRLLGAKYLGRMQQRDPADVAKAMFGDTPEVEMILRAPVTPGTTTGATFAEPLVQYQNMASEFVDMLRPATIIGRIPGLRRVPFNIKVPRATSGASVNWVGEAKVKPVSSMAFDSLTLGFYKVAGIIPITMELMRFSNPAAEGLIRDELINAVAYLTDRDFLDPTKAEAVGVSPASITNGVTPITATGITADALRADLGTLLVEYAEANMGVGGLVLVMTSSQAIRISLMRNTLGQKEFEGLTPSGGTLEGIPVITSENIVATGGSPADGGLIVAINATDVLLADDGGVEIDVSTEASLQMESAPDSPPTASTVLVSLWQHNMVGIRAERFINWKKRRDTAVQFIQNAKYA